MASASDLSKGSASASNAAEVKVFNRAAYLSTDNPEVRIHYVEAYPASSPPGSERNKGTILLIHGFPETSYQFRHVMQPLARAGYHVVAPDKKGHGFSSKPIGNNTHQQEPFTKKSLAQDLHELVTKHLNVKNKIHLVGHDIGGMVAHAYVCQFPEGVASVAWGECPLPGSTIYERERHSRTLWHFDFQSHNPDIAVALVQGKEKMYLKHFYDRLAQNQAAFTPDVVDFYAAQFAMPDALRCAFLTYRAFELDAVHNREWRSEQGRIKVKNMILSGAKAFMVDVAEDMAHEFYEDVTPGVVPDSGHYLAEENPEGFVREVLRFIES
jgi:pimeloyl-ACP methyl ester carboxylesterase